MGPISPPDLKPDLKMEMKPDMSMLNGNMMGGFSPIGGGNGSSGGGPSSPGGYNQMQQSITTTSPGGTKTRSPYPPNHPLSGSKHLCSICGDRASGKHYGVYRWDTLSKVFKFDSAFLWPVVVWITVARDVKASLSEPYARISHMLAARSRTA